MFLKGSDGGWDRIGSVLTSSTDYPMDELAPEIAVSRWSLVGGSGSLGML